MSNVLDRAPARTVRPGRVALTVIAAVLFGVGWLAGTIWLALSWSGTAVRVGWTDGRRGPA